MKARPNQVFIEFKESSVHVLDGADGAELPLEREANGKISGASRAAVANGLRGFLQRNGVVGQRRGICGLPARGVSFRTIGLPAGVKREDTNKLLTMQIEAQFPVPPSELAWGYSRIRARNGKADNAAGPNGQNGPSEFFVAAVRRDVIEDYKTLLAGCGISPVFTVAALARAGTPIPGAVEYPGSLGILEVGAERSELLVFDQERWVPSLRVINWGRTQANQGEMEPLRSSLPAEANTTVYLSGADGVATAVVSALGGSMRAQTLPVGQGQGVTAATEGLRKLAALDGLLLLGAPEESAQTRALPKHWQWAAAATVLLVATLSLRYVEAVLFRSQLTGKLNELMAYRKTLPNLSNEVSFLNFIQTNQPPYLDTIAVMADAAPPGTKLDQVMMVRRGDISLRGSMQDPQGPEKFRTKLIDSGFFSKVVVEEQGPAKQGPGGGGGQDKISFRISGVLKPHGARKELPPEPPLTNKTGKAGAPMSMPGGVSPGMPGEVSGMPPGMPPNMPPPGARPMPMPAPVQIPPQ